MSELITAAADPDLCDAVASTAVFVVRTAASQQTLSVADAARLRPDDLLPTRRPASYRGMRNFIGRACVPSEAGPSAVWFESLNERNHLRDLMLTRRVVGLATQPMLVVWSLPGGVRRHFPDMLVRYASGRVMACDVTRLDGLTRPAVLAQFTLMAATARGLGWDLEIRTEMPAQRVRNQSHVHACRHAEPADRERWVSLVADGPADATLGEFVARCGGGPRGIGAALHLLARGELSIDFDQPLANMTPTRRWRAEPSDVPWVRRL